MLTLALALASFAGTQPSIPQRPLPTYLQVAPPSVKYAAGNPLNIYLNHFGGNYSCPLTGEDDSKRNFSSIACGTTNGRAEITPFAANNLHWVEVRDCVQELFSPFNMIVTDIEPLEGTYIEAVIGGSPDQAGMQPSVGGVAPFACEVIPSGIVYAFSDIYGNDFRGVCETAAQEIAHAFGLDHEFLCADPMTYLVDCGEKEFRDQWVPCGEFEPRECTCGEPTQNSVYSMTNLFGLSDGTFPEPVVDNTPPSVEILAPGNDDILPSNQDVVITATASDDVGLTVVELEWDFTGETMFCPTDAPNFTCTQDGSTYTWKIPDTAGNRPFRVHVRDVAGHDATSDDRKVWLSPDGSGPPEDHVPPSVFVGAPLDGATLPTGEDYVVVATIVDDHGIAHVELASQTANGTRVTPCPYEDNRSSCDVNGSTYTWHLRSRRDGDRAYTITAVDVVGNKTASDAFNITFATGAVLPDDDSREGDDSADDATKLSCNDAVNLVSNDADWFTIDAPPGNSVEVSVKGADASLVALDGGNVLADGNGKVSTTAPDEAMHVAVLPPSGGAARAYSIHVKCTAPPKPAPPKGCGASGGFGALIALAALVRRRRR